MSASHREADDLTKRTAMYHLLFFVFKLVSYIPFRLLYVLSDILFYPLYYVVRYRRKIVRKNLTESFPEKSPAEIKRIERKFYRFFVDIALECCKLLSISPDEMKRRVRFVNIDEVNAVLREGRSISAFLGHYGNWEWLSSVGLWLTGNARCAQIYHKLRNRTMDRLLLRVRERLGSQCVDMYHTARFVADKSKSPDALIFGFIADQSPKAHEAKHYLDFLNHRVPVLTGTEKITKHYGYEAMFVGVRRVGRGYYECEFSTLHDDPKSLPDFELTELYYRRLEQEIRQQPELYLWSHNRFKHAKSASDVE